MLEPLPSSVNGSLVLGRLVRAGSLLSRAHMTTTPAPSAPPFCPNPACHFHTEPSAWRYVRDGYHARQIAPHRVQRFRCRHCGRRFSEQTFSTTYWLKRPGLLAGVLHGLLSCSCLRQMGRALEASPQTILTHANRLGRHCLLFHESTRPRGAVAEPLALDGFASFEYSQYYPTSYHVVTGTDSHFFYGFTDSELRRSGRMTRGQKRRRATLEKQFGKPDPRSTQHEVAAVLQILCPAPQRLHLHTDQHAAYPLGLKQLKHLTVTHRTISSRAARTAHNPLFPINLLDLLLRHCSSNHKRETIAFSKRRQMAIWRMWVFVVWRNHMKWFSERRRQWTPAMRLGLAERRLLAPDILKERLFVSRVGLPLRWQTYYWGTVATRPLPKGRAHRCSYAA